MIREIDELISTMGFFYHDEEAPNHPKRCKFLVATLKEVFSRCQIFSGRLSTSSLEKEEYEYPMSDFDEEQEVFISAVISQAMENKKYKPSVLRHSFSWVYSPVTKELYFTTTQAVSAQEKVEGDQEQDEREEFYSVKSCFSCCSSSVSGETFHSVKTSLSRCSSLNEVDLSKYWRRSVIQEFCHCEGWPFGLCRRALLLPPLPKSPSESWLSGKIHRSTKKP